MESSGYLLDEQSGSAGTGPQRYISLEEDTQGYDHQYESIPFTHVDVSWTNSQTTGWLILQEDESGGILYEDDLEPTLGQRMLTEYSHVTTSDEGRFKRIVPTIEYVNHLSTSILDRFLYEDGDILEMEDNSQLIQEGDPSVRMPDKEYEFNLVDTVNWHLLTEDGAHLIVEGDEATDLARFLTEEFPGPKVEAIDIEIDGTTGIDGYAGTSTIGDHGIMTINDYVISPRAITSTFGAQVFRPHYVSQ